MTGPLVQAPSIAAISCAALAWWLAAGEASAQDAGAEALFADGEKLFADGKLAEACAAFEGSNRIEPRAGTLINLGTCRERNHQLASAWSAFKDALTRAKDPRKKQLAEAGIQAIEPRLSFLTIAVPDDSRIDGLVVTRNGNAVDPALWNRAVPVDGGSYVIGGLAPGHEPWSTSVAVAHEGAKLSVEVPRVKELVTRSISPTSPGAPPPGPGPLDAAPPAIPRPSSLTGKRQLALGLGGLGVVAAATAVVLGGQFQDLESDAFGLCPDPAVPCADSDRANQLIDRSQHRAVLANGAYGVAGAAALGAVILWVVGGPDGEESRVTIAPRLGDRRTGIDVAWSF